MRSGRPDALHPHHRGPASRSFSSRAYSRRRACSVPIRDLNRVSGLTRTRPMEGTCSGGTSLRRSSRGSRRWRASARRRGSRTRRRARRAPIQVGVVYSRTGLLAAYGAQFVQGLRYGLAYATKGTNAVNGRKIELTLVDDGTDPVKAVAGAKDLIGKGYKIITGTVSSGIALQLAPLAVAEQHPLHLRPGGDRRDPGDQQEHVPLGSPVDPGRARPPARTSAAAAGKNVTVFAQDSAFGPGQLPRRQAADGGPRRPEGEPRPRPALGAGLHAVRPADQAAADRPPLRRVGRDDRLPRCGVRSTSRASSRASTRSSPASTSGPSYPTFGPVASKISFLSHYVSNAPKNKVNDFLVSAMRKRGPGARPLHAGRVRRGPDDRAGAHRRARRRRREDDLRARGLELHGPEGPADDPRRPTTRCCSRCSR